MKKYIFLLFSFFIIKNVFPQWNNVGMGVNAAVNCFYVDSASNLLFVGGQFSEAGGKSINNLATWDGSNWNQFGNNEVFSSPGVISAIVNFNGSIVVAGRFDSIGNSRVNNIAKWNGLVWEPIGKGFDKNVSDLIVYKNELYATGSFSFSGTDYISCLAKWNGTNWLQISQILNIGYSFTIYKDELIIGGAFYPQSNTSFQNILGWDGLKEDTTFGHFNEEIFKVRVIDDTLYAVGSFTATSSVPGNYISLYYDSLWHSIGSPTGGPNWILDVNKYHNKLYLCGYFTNPPDLCMYNGFGFDSVADVQGFIKILIRYKDKLYIAGSFSELNGDYMNNIAEFNNLNDFIENNNQNNDKIFNVYPNPSFTGQFNLDLNTTYKNEKIKVNIYAVDFKLISSTEVLNNNSRILSLNVPSKGIYYLNVLIDNSVFFIKKIVAI